MRRGGIPLLLAIALAVTLAIAQPWRAGGPVRPADDAAVTRPARHAVSAPSARAPAAAPSRGVDLGADLGADDRLALTRPEPVDGGGPAFIPTPTVGDIPSAVAAARAAAERLRGGAPTASMLADQNATETPMGGEMASAPTVAEGPVDAPEAGALYWFGPQGLVKLQTTGEGQR